MTEKRSLSFQRQCVEHLIALHRDEDDSIIDGAKQAALTIGWIERREELIKMLEQLRKDNPELYNMFVYLTRAFPGASISDIRATEDLAREAGL